MGRQKNTAKNAAKNAAGNRENNLIPCFWAGLILLSVIFILSVRDAGKYSALRMLLMCIIVSFLSRPLLPFGEMELYDGGFAYSLILGLFLSFFLTFMICGISGGRVAYDYPVCFISFIVIVLLAAFILLKGKIIRKGGRLRPFKDDYYASFIRYIKALAAFCVLFAICYWVKGFRADIVNTTEQYMDFGFLQAFYRQKSMFPEDIWQCGARLNYYYLGQAFVSFMGRLSFVKPEFGYNLSFCVLFAALGLSAYTLVAGILSYLNTSPFSIKLGGMAACIITLMSGNGHFVIYGLLIPCIEALTGQKLNYRDSYWFSDATTFIGNYPDTADKGKNEFPAYSFVLGDLHAHVISLFFTTFLLALLFEYAIGRQEEISDGKSDAIKSDAINSDAAALKRHNKNLNLPVLGLLTLLLAFFTGSNYWDAPIYFVISGAVILFCELKCTSVYIKSDMTLTTSTFSFDLGTSAAGINGSSVKEQFCNAAEYTKCVVRVLLAGFAMQVIGWILMLPFSLEFEKMASEICLCSNHSPFGKMLILWGIPVLVAIGLLVYIMQGRAGKATIDTNNIKNIGKPQNISTPKNIGKTKDTGAENKKNIYAEYSCGLNCAHLYLIVLILCAIGLVIVPEIVYVKDIYGEDYARFNTMFKLTYQAFLIFCLVTGVAIGLFLDSVHLRRIGIIICMAELMLSFYMINAVYNWFGNIFDADAREGISGTAYLYGNYDTIPEIEAINVVNEDKRRSIHIMEAGGNSYTADNKLSTFTGGCAVAGWYVHEWMWHNDNSEMTRRNDEIRTFYQSGDADLCRRIIEEYDIDYIYVGPREWSYYNINEAGFISLGEVIWQDELGHKLIAVGGSQ